MTFGQIIKNARLDMKKTQDDLVLLINNSIDERFPVEKYATLNKSLKISSKSTISNWENDISKPDADTIGIVAAILDIDIYYLLGLDKKRLEKINVYTDPETGLTVQLRPTDKPWEEYTKEEQEQYISQAMDALYEYKRNMKNNDKI